MATLGNFLVTKILGHSDAEKAFRPWWDNFEDFLVYGLVMLGLIVAPTALVNGTPLDCNLCANIPCNYSLETKQDGIVQEDPHFNLNWVKKYCTATAVDGFIVYFPFILLVIALVIVLIERVFIRIFKAGLKLDTLFNLLVKEALENDALLTSTTSPKEMPAPVAGTAQPTPTTAIVLSGLENTKMAIEVSHSFNNSSSYFFCYLIRTLSETLIAGSLQVWLVIWGLPAIKKDEMIYCDAHGYLYECSGHPQEFYMYVLFITIAILTCYLICCFFNLLWLAIPYMASLNRVMNAYKRELKRQHQEAGIKATDQQILGNLYDVYFNNTDLKLLLNLLATSSGISLSLRVLTLFDKKFRSKMEPESLEVNMVPNPTDQKFDLEVSFEDPISIKNNFSKIKHITTIYTVELVPPPPSGDSAVHVFKYGSDNSDEDEGIFPAISRAGKSRKKVTDIELQKLKQGNSKKLRFNGLDTNQEYTVRVCTVVNGRAIARKIKRIEVTPTGQS